jgi:sugar-specific transcriptional regulator TrmB
VCYHYVMKNNELLKQLQELGLSDKESKLYIWLVEHVQSTGYEASVALKLPRGTTYTLLESLVGRGIVQSSIENKRRVYTPEPFSAWKRNLQDKLHKVGEMIPTLEGLMKVRNENVSVRIYKGTIGLKQAWEAVIEHYEENCVKTCFAISHGSEIYATMPKYFKKWVERRVANKTEAYLIYPMNDRLNVESGEIRERLAEYKFAPGESLAFKGDVTLGGDITAIFSFDENKELHAVIIESKEIANILSQWFRVMWGMLK